MSSIFSEGLRPGKRSVPVCQRIRNWVFLNRRTVLKIRSLRWPAELETIRISGGKAEYPGQFPCIRKTYAHAVWKFHFALESKDRNDIFSFLTPSASIVKHKPASQPERNVDAGCTTKTSHKSSTNPPRSRMDFEVNEIFEIFAQGSESYPARVIRHE
jgi:hypothetical protein